MRVGQTTTDTDWWSMPAAPESVGYAVNDLNQYTTVGGETPGYDDNGNLTDDGTFTYGYDAENRLVAVEEDSTPVAAYAYDARGRRKSRTVGEDTTVYVTDADDREVLEYDGSTGAVLRWHSYGPGLDEPLNRMEVAAGSRATLIPDIQGPRPRQVPATRPHRLCWRSQPLRLRRQRSAQLRRARRVGAGDNRQCCRPGLPAGRRLPVRAQ